jgi:hypothetical protein
MAVEANSKARQADQKYFMVLSPSEKKSGWSGHAEEPAGSGNAGFHR